MSAGRGVPLGARALNPLRNVVVAACAGSGKTWLLVSRILRLLLAGVAPGEILAITFTRAAAQEMAARLREWLQYLAGADDEGVRRFLLERYVPEDEMDAGLGRARMLHEQVLTAQPAITITTFHSWYLQLLRNAPLSAGALGSLTLNEQTAALVDEAWELFAEACRRNPSGPAAIGLDVLFRDHGRDGARRLLTNFLQHRADWWAYAGRGEDAVPRALERLRRALDVDPAADLVANALLQGKLQDDAAAYAALLARNTPNDQASGARLTSAVEGGNSNAMFEALCSVLFTAKSERRVRKPSPAQRKRLGDAGETALLKLHAELCERLEALKLRLVDQQSYFLHEAALPAAAGLLGAYQQLKRDRQIVDFADVEWLAYELLAEHEQAITLQYKLDSRYRHILLDEFQDTNPLQWLSLKAWFDASASSQSLPIVFLVGDPKQAIYRFRRAEAKLFDAARKWLVDEQNADALEQDESRRCAPQVLDIVNRVFAQEPTFAADFRTHTAHDPRLPGRVEVLPLAMRSIAGIESDPDAGTLRDPLTQPAADVEDLRRELEAAEVVAKLTDVVANWKIAVSGGSDEGRSVTYSDIMILVRRRTHLQVYERALRRARIPFRTSRRGGLLETLEVQDLVALLGFLVSPFDDLKLAHALRSPIFGCTDDDLMIVARLPGATWWARLLAWADLDPSTALGRARVLLARWIDRADRLPVHDHLDRIYFEAQVEHRYAAAVPGAVREAVVANLHAFIERALALDSGRYPSLPRFLDELKDLDRVPAQEAPDEGGVDDGGNAVRMLTVHGAKGLEAPIVVLIDAAAGATSDRGYDCLVDWPTGEARPKSVSFRTRRSEWNSLQRTHMSREAASDEREDLNLLYVAMTRARQALIVSGCESGRSGGSWYERIRSAVVEATDSTGRPESGCVAYGISLDAGTSSLAAASPAMGAPDPSLPSIVVPALVPTGRRRETAMSAGQLYGTVFHRVMECLAVDAHADVEAIASRYGLTPEEVRRCVAQARRLTRNAAVRRFLDPTMFIKAFNELPLVDEYGNVRRIDRLVEFADEVWVLDYKTGEAIAAEGSELAAEYREQVAAYCRSVRAVFPGKRVRGALVFADGDVVEVAG